MSAAPSSRSPTTTTSAAPAVQRATASSRPKSAARRASFRLRRSHGRDRPPSRTLCAGDSSARPCHRQRRNRDRVRSPVEQRQRLVRWPPWSTDERPPCRAENSRRHRGFRSACAWPVRSRPAPASARWRRRRSPSPGPADRRCPPSSPSKRSAHRCAPVAASMSWPVMRTRLPALRTLPSST